MIRFDNVSVTIGAATVLDGVSLELGERRVGVIGPNGGGKSTLARLVNGLAAPSRGRVEVDGLDVARHGAAVRRRVGYLFTDPDAQIVMPTVAEDVAFSLRRLRLSRDQVGARVTAALEQFGLAGLHDRPAHNLSGGQKQLLALAAILIGEPDVLVADEPTTLLDLRNTHQIAAVLAGLRQQVLLVTHDLELVSACDRVICLDGGRVVADGGADEVVAFYRARMLA